MSAPPPNRHTRRRRPRRGADRDDRRHRHRQPSPLPPRPPIRRRIPRLRHRRVAAARLRAGRRLATARLANRRAAVADRACPTVRPVRGAGHRCTGPRRADGARDDRRLPRAPPVHLRVRGRRRPLPTRRLATPGARRAQPAEGYEARNPGRGEVPAPVLRTETKRSSETTRTPSSTPSNPRARTTHGTGSAPRRHQRRRCR